MVSDWSTPLELTFANRADWTLSNILELQAERYGERIFLTESEYLSYSYRETNEIASRIAGGLIARDFRLGDRLMILMDNCSEYIHAWFGAARAGVVEVPTNTSYFGDFLAHVLQLTTPAGVVVGSTYVRRFLDLARDGLQLSLRFFVVGDSAVDDVAILKRAGLQAELYDDLVRSPPLEELPKLTRSNLCAIIFTSGTTGPSKGVMIPHGHAYFASEQCISQVRLTGNDVYMTANPLFHFNAQFLTTYPTLIAGARMHLYKKFSPSQFSRRLADSGATVTNLVGVMMEWVAKQPPQESDKASNLRCVFSAPTAWDLVPEMRRRFGIEAFAEGFGHTETGQPILAPYGIDRPSGASGKALSDWFEIQLADPDTDEPVAPGQVGELQLRPREPWIINSGYFNMPAVTAEARRNLWFHTGDGLRQDPDGWYYFVDRFKDCLRRRGENISSFEVERPVLMHPSVLSCAAVGVPADERGGEEELALFVVPKESMTVTADEISKWAAARLPAFLNPRYITLVGELPMTPSGKVRKADLRRIGAAEAWDRLQHEAAAIQTAEPDVSHGRGA